MIWLLPNVRENILRQPCLEKKILDFDARNVTIVVCVGLLKQ